MHYECLVKKKLLLGVNFRRFQQLYPCIDDVWKHPLYREKYSKKKIHKKRLLLSFTHYQPIYWFHQFRAVDFDQRPHNTHIILYSICLQWCRLHAYYIKEKPRKKLVSAMYIGSYLCAVRIFFDITHVKKKDQ